MGDTWAPREGAYGRTRVGPIERVFPNCGYHDDWKWRVEGGSFWDAHGKTWDKGDAPSPSDIVAEWTEDGPVRTVTRREIVPGTYGHVTVGRAVNIPDCANPDVPDLAAVGVYLEGDLNADELDAAARVLTKLAEALRDRG